MRIQARILPATCAMHNFIRKHDDQEILAFPPDITDPSPGQRNGALSVGAITRREKIRAETRRDEIAAAMWRDYQTLLNERR